VIESDEEQGRDLSRLVVSRAGRLVTTGDAHEPYHVVGPGGEIVEPVSAFLRDLLASPEQAALWAKNRDGSSGVILHYRVPVNMFDRLSGMTFPDANSAYLALVYSMRSGGSMHAYDYVEGPLLGNPADFLAGKEPITFGNQISFHTQTAIDRLSGYLLP